MGAWQIQIYTPQLIMLKETRIKITLKETLKCMRGETLWIIVLKPGPARRVDQGPGRPGHGTGPGGGQNPLGNWPGRPDGSTWDPVHPAKPGWDPTTLFSTFPVIKRRRLMTLKTYNHTEKRSRRRSEERSNRTKNEDLICVARIERSRRRTN